MSALDCIDCGRQVDPNARSTLSEVTGFAKYRGGKGGTNHVIDQKKTGRLLCGHCAERRRLHMPPGQTSLL
jgi:hypothetical protein